MDEEKSKGPLGRMFDSIDSKFGIEKSPNIKTVYQYPKFGEPILWIDQWTKEKDFKSWYYSTSSSAKDSDVKLIPGSNIANVIHFFPSEAEEAYKKQKTEETSWLEDEKFRSQSLSIMKKYIPAFVDLLGKIKNGTLQGVDYIIGETNYRMANIVLALGFKRCWEEEYMQPDLSVPMTDESTSYKIGISVADLIDYYGLKDQIPTEELVRQKMKEYSVGRHSGKVTTSLI